MPKKFILFFLLLFFSAHLHAEIDKNHLVLLKYQDKNYHFEILHRPVSGAGFGSHGGVASYKITDKNTNKIFYIPHTSTNILYSTDIDNELNLAHWSTSINKNDLMTFHQENNLSNVFTINKTSEFNVGYIDNCEEKNYFTNALDTEFTHEANDQCYYLSDEAPVSLFDIDFDGENEILILIKFKGQRHSDRILVLELDGNESSSVPSDLDNYRTSINITKKLISTFASGGCCYNEYFIHKVIDGKLTLTHVEGMAGDIVYLNQCTPAEDFDVKSCECNPTGKFDVPTCDLIIKSED